MVDSHAYIHTDCAVHYQSESSSYSCATDKNDTTTPSPEQGLSGLA